MGCMQVTVPAIVGFGCRFTLRVVKLLEFSRPDIPARVIL